MPVSFKHRGQVRRPAGTHNDVSSNALHHHCVHPMDVRISIDPQTHLKEE